MVFVLHPSRPLIFSSVWICSAIVHFWVVTIFSLKMHSTSRFLSITCCSKLLFIFIILKQEETPLTKLLGHRKDIFLTVWKLFQPAILTQKKKKNQSKSLPHTQKKKPCKHITYKKILAPNSESPVFPWGMKAEKDSLKPALTVCYRPVLVFT